MNVPASGTVQRCESCSATLSELSTMATCPSCGGLLLVEHRIERSAATLRERFARRSPLAHLPYASGVWRYHELVLPSVAPEEIVTHPEGNTPLIARTSVAQYAGCGGLLMKHEGHNPTGSFKDRGMTVGITQARRLGAAAVACASTGNTSSSLAAYAAQAGLRALVFVPAGQVALGKLTQTLAYGARTLLVRADFDGCLALARQASAELGIYLLNSINPYRLEGQKTAVIELLEQLDWRAPDWIVLPAGNLGNTAAFGKALAELRALGIIERVPRLAAIQAEGAAPFARAFAEQFAVRRSVQADTVATAIRIGAPASWDRAVRAIRETNGVVQAVGDEAILDAKAVIDAAGVGCEPASAASIAGIRALVAAGIIAPNEQVVAVLTGHVLKDPGVLVRYHQETEPPTPRANRPVEIEPDIRAVARAMETTADFAR